MIAILLKKWVSLSNVVAAGEYNLLILFAFVLFPQMFSFIQKKPSYENMPGAISILTKVWLYY